MQGKCDLCPLGATAFHTVHSVGHDNPDLYIVGDYPRQEDDTSGYPMTGNQYKFIWDTLNSMGVAYRVGYAIRCMAVDPYARRVRKPEKAEIDNCATHHLFRELDELKPKAVLLLGQIPVDLFYGEGTTIANARAKTGEYTLPSGHVVKVIASYHPSFVVSKGDEMFFNRFMDDVVYSCRHAMAYKFKGKYVTKTVNVDVYERLVDHWIADESIEYVSFDSESNTLDPLYKGAKVTSISMTVDGVVGFNVYLYHPEHPDITESDRDRIKMATKRLLLRKKVIAQHAKHEHRMLKPLFGFTPNIVDDTMYMAYILYMSYPGITNGLKFLAGRFLVMPPWEEKIDRYVTLFKHMKRYKSMEGRWDQLVEEYKDIDVHYDDLRRFWDILQDPSYYMKHERSDSGDDVFMWMIPSRIMEEYAGYDVIAPFHLHKMFRKMIDEDPDLRIAYERLVKGANVFANVELKGTRIHGIEMWTERYKEEVEKSIQELRRFPEVQQFEEDEGIDEYNPNSTQQNSKVFFTYMGLPVGGTTAKGEPSTSETNIIDLLNKYEGSETPGDLKKLAFLSAFRRYKKLKKLLSSYFEGLTKFISTNNAFDGHTCETLPVPAGVNDLHIHPQYKLHGTETGRLSSQNPSMHTIPYHSDVKKMFVPHNFGRGGLFVGADQSQLELRVVASVVEKWYGDSSMADAYRRGEDIHLYNASKVFAKPMDQILEAERRFAKTISFSLLYGSSEGAVAEQTGRTRDEVSELFQSFFISFPGIKAYIDDMHNYAKQHGCVRTPMGRIRHIHGALDPTNRGEFSAAMRRAQNTPIQSAGSDISLESINYMDEQFELSGAKSKVVAFVHDSITLDVANGEFVECVDMLLDAMKTRPEQLDWITCPLGVDLEISDNLGEAASLKRHVQHNDGSFEMDLKGFSYIIDNVVSALKFDYDIVSDVIVKEEDFTEVEGSLIAKKVLNLSFTGQTFKNQVRTVVIKKK